MNYNINLNNVIPVENILDFDLLINIIILILIFNFHILNFLIINVNKLIILIHLNFLINVIFLNLIFNYLIYNFKFNSNLVKLINLSKLFINIYKSLSLFTF